MKKVIALAVATAIFGGTTSVLAEGGGGGGTQIDGIGIGASQRGGANTQQGGGGAATQQGGAAGAPGMPNTGMGGTSK